MSKKILDNLQQIKKLDSQNMLGSLQLLSHQVKQIWEQAPNLRLPADYGKISNILVLGMGGSALGAYVFQSVFGQELKAPVTVVSDYQIPGFVNKQTLVIASSYSGNTEEPVNAVKEAKKRKAKIVVLAAGGELASWAKKNRVPGLIFSTENNPSHQPRMGLGYMIVGKLILLAKAGLLKMDGKLIKEIVNTLTDYNRRFGVDVAFDKNIVKQLATKIQQKTVWFVGSEHLAGNIHAAANQMNENGKRFGGYFVIPELNHHLMEGMKYPPANKQNLFFILFESKLYLPSIQKRYQITKEVLNKNGIQYLAYQAKSKSRILQACEVLVFGAYLSFYSAILSGIDPSPIHFVDYFKEQMKK